MAKAKKSDASKAAAPKKKAATTPQAPTPKPAAPTGPVIDTNRAAQAAAKSVANRDRSAPVAAEGEAGKESGSFKNLKDSFKKPAAGAGDLLHKLVSPTGRNDSLHNVLGKNQGGFKANTGGFQSRGGVPRRTNG